MKKLSLPFIAIACCSLTSCPAIDFQVDKRQVISETKTHLVVPSTAVVPYVNINPLIISDYFTDKNGNESSKGGLLSE